jgi:hypothetical protein
MIGLVYQAGSDSIDSTPDAPPRSGCILKGQSVGCS